MLAEPRGLGCFTDGPGRFYASQRAALPPLEARLTPREGEAPPEEPPPIGVLYVALSCTGVGAAFWYICGYKTFFLLQLLDLLGQGGGAAAGGYFGLISNACEVAFCASFCLAEIRFFSAYQRFSDDKQRPLIEGGGRGSNL